MTALDRATRLLDAGRDLVEKVPLPRTDDIELRLHKTQRRLDRLQRLSEIYGPYVELDCVFDDRSTRELLDGLHADDRERFHFDVDAIDWDEYLRNIHLPALRELAVPPAPGPKRTRERRRCTARRGPPGAGHLRRRGRRAGHDRRALLRLAAHARHAGARPGAVERRDPGQGPRLGAGRPPLARRVQPDFYRVYRDLPVRELQAQAKAALPDFIQPRIQNEAVRRIRAHKRRGDQVILVTGALDFLVDSLRHLGDELIAARLVERTGRFTGELAEPPLTADGRASLAARLAAEHGVELADCHAYGDSLADLPLLELVGHPHAINPDFRLAREARRRRWPVESGRPSGRRSDARADLHAVAAALPRRPRRRCRARRARSSRTSARRASRARTGCRSARG